MSGNQLVDAWSASRSRCDARSLAWLPAARRLLAVVALATTASGCAVAVAGKPKPYAGSLHEGLLVRAILERGSPPFGEIHATRRVSRDSREVAIVSFSSAPLWRPEAGGTMVVFRVVGSWTYHTPADAARMHEWLSVYESELVDVELSEDEAIAAARSCLARRAEAAAYDPEDPFAFGPGTAGGWTVRFDSADAEESSAPPITIELDRRGRCIENSSADRH
jgi:hypothetical protein